MTPARTVLAETLDGLAADDPAAIASRRDLRRIHRVMGTRAILRRAFAACLPAAAARRPLRILELGAGDGTLLLGVAGDLARDWPPVALTLLDRQPLLAKPSAVAYQRLGWTVQMEAVDVFDWVARGNAAGDGESAAQWDIVLANLFLHHFPDEELAQLLRAAARRCLRFIAVEPRRARFPLLASRLVGLLGANAVTREDAVLSVRAGFRGSELGGLWGAADGWELREHRAGLFSHVFQAARCSAALIPSPSPDRKVPA